MTHLERVRTELLLAPRHRVVGQLEGAHPAVFPGRSLDFSDLREYVRGDDLRDVDWRASARTGQMLVREYVAQRRQCVLLIVPTGGSLAASANATESKAQVAVACAATVASIALQQGDRVTVVSAEDGVPTIARPSARDVDVERMLRTVDARCVPDAATADLAALLGHATTGIRHRGFAVVILDDWEPDPFSVAALRSLGHRHDVIAMTVTDADPTDSVFRGAHVVGQEDRRVLPWFASLDNRLHRDVVADRRRRAEVRDRTLTSLGILHVEVPSCDRAVPATLDLLRRLRLAHRS